MTVGYTLAALRPRNAEPLLARPLQTKLNVWRDRLVEAYGWRAAPDGRRLPHLPVPFAERMLRAFQAEATRWLKAGNVPEGALQPNFIRDKFARATAQLGRWEGNTIAIDPAGVERAPAVVAGRDLPDFEGQRLDEPALLVLTVDRTQEFLYRLRQLAIHFDVLSGQPTKWDIAKEAVKETVQELPKKLPSSDSLTKTLLIAGAAAVGLLLVARS